MNQKEKASSALTAVFPNTKSIADFVTDSEDRTRMQSFVEFAAQHGLIDAPTHEAFQAFIDANSRPTANADLDNLTLEELISHGHKYLNIKISNRALIDKINGFLTNHAIQLPQLSNAMFTRLKRQMADTPRKRDALRSFAFWIGYERGDMGQEWHYETLKALCNDDVSKTFNSSCGIRMAFSINSRGNIIGQDIITWMKRTIRNTLITRTDHFPNGNPPKIKNYDLTTFQVDLPNSDQSAIPSAYADTLNQAIAMAHQIALRWILSGFASDNLFFSIGLAAGNFEAVNNQLQAVLKAKLPEDPVIRLTDYARQCAMINQIKIILNHGPKEIELVSGEAFKVWWITELSGMIYWDLVPEIISEKSLKSDSLNFLNLKRQLSITGEVNSCEDNDAINCFLRFPHYPMLGAEIVRALICKKRFSESLEILNALLRVTPFHLNSRIAKMMLYKFLGAEAPNYYSSDILFRMAENEANYILENIGHIGEDFYYEYALLKLARLSTAIRALRQHKKNSFEVMDVRLAASDLIALTHQAEEITMKGITVSSPTVERILYLFLCVQVLKCVLFESIKDEGALTSRLTCPNDKIKQHMFSVFAGLYQQVFTLGASDLNLAMQFVTETVNRTDSMIALEAFKPMHFFSVAVFYWDIMPVRNVAIVKETLHTLGSLLKFAKAYALKNEPIYSIANLSGQLIPANHFISQINVVIKEIERRYPKASELKKMDPAAVIGRADDDLVLMTYHV